MSEEIKSELALAKCSYWLATCLQFGWRPAHVVELEALWWKHHDAQGELK